MIEKYKQVFVECKEFSKGLAGYKWELGATKDLPWNNSGFGEK